jgi:hypothetical protein
MERTMPKSFFHVHRNDVLEQDVEGIDLASPEQAREEAIAAAREIVAVLICAGHPADRDVFEIMTEDATLVAIVPFQSVLS